MSNKNQGVGECGYCGKVRPVTADHVIPKCLFPKPRPANLVKVPACASCNNEKSKADAYLRDFLVTDAYSSENVAAQTDLKDAVLRSLRRGSSDFAKDAVRTAVPHAVFSPGGEIYIGEVLSVPIDDQLVFPWVIRGLYHSVVGRPIPDNYTFNVGRLNPFTFEETITKFLCTNHFGPFHVGDNDEFICMFICSAEDRFSTIWLLWFFGTIGFSVIVEPEAATNLGDTQNEKGHS